MKCKVKAKELKTALKTVTAIFAVDKTDQRSCELAVKKAKGDDFVLQVTAVFAGIFVRKVIPVVGLRAGKVTCNMKDLEALPIKGDVVINANQDTIVVSCGRSTWSFGADESIEAEVAAHKEDIKAVKVLAVMPRVTFQAATKTTSFKTHTGDFVIQITIENEMLEYVGRDFVGFGRYKISDGSISAKKHFSILIANNILKTIMKDAAGELIRIGVSKDGSIVLLSTQDTTVLYPGTTGSIIDIDSEALSQRDTGDKTFGFTTDIVKIQKAIDAVMPAYKAGADVAIKIGSNSVHMVADGENHTAQHKLQTTDLESKKKVSVNFNLEYVAEFVKSAPKGLPLLVEAWDKTYLYLAIKTDAGIVDYMVVTQN